MMSQKRFLIPSAVVLASGLAAIAACTAPSDENIGEQSSKAVTVEERAQGSEGIRGNPHELCMRLGLGDAQKRIENVPVSDTQSPYDMFDGFNDKGDKIGEVSLSNITVGSQGPGNGKPLELDWDATIGVNAVLVHTSSIYRIYKYDPAQMSGDDVRGRIRVLPNEREQHFPINQIIFCYDKPTTPPPPEDGGPPPPPPPPPPPDGGGGTTS